MCLFAGILLGAIATYLIGGYFLIAWMSALLGGAEIDL